MGTKASSHSSVVNKHKEGISRNHFEFLYVVGKGGFGKVWKVQSKKNKKQFALKEMNKAKIIDKKSEKSIKYERELLSRLKHPFIVNMQYAFQDYENLYLVMDLLTGGDLRYHVSRHRRFSEEQTRFFIACLVLGLEYLHNNNVLHRDIKPENLVMDERGYVRITDFGIAKLHQKENSSETSGTPGYMSPEVMCAQNHTHAVDYFAVGVIGYEFMNGRRPYVGKSRKEIKEQIMAKQVLVKENEIPEGWSTEAADFINKCLQRRPVNRLGLKGAHEVKDHPWLKYYPWKDLYNKKLESPFIPKVGDNFDKKYCESQDKLGTSTLERYQKYIRDENFPNAFLNFTYINHVDTDVEIEYKNNKDVNRGYKDLKTLRESKANLFPTSKLSGISSKLTSSASSRKYNLNNDNNPGVNSINGLNNINILKNKVKIIDNNSQMNTGNSANSGILSYSNNNSSVSMRSNLSQTKVTKNVNNIYNNYLQKVGSQSNIHKNIPGSISNSSLSVSKYTPYRDKKVTTLLDSASSKNIIPTNKATPGHHRTASVGTGSASSSNVNLLNGRILSGKINNINMDKMKLTKKLTNSSSTAALFKNYKQGNTISQSSTGSSVGSSLKFFIK